MAADTKKKVAKPVKAVKAKKAVKSVKAAAKTHKKAAKPVRPSKPAPVPAPKVAVKAAVAARPGFGVKPPVPKMSDVVKMTKAANAPVAAKPVKAEAPFSEGDYVVYPTHGVGRVRAIERQSIAGHRTRTVRHHLRPRSHDLARAGAEGAEVGIAQIVLAPVMDTALSTLQRPRQGQARHVEPPRPGI